VNQFDPVIMDFGIFLLVLFPVEIVLPEWALVGIGLVIPPIARAFEQVGAEFALLCLKTRWV